MKTRLLVLSIISALLFCLSPSPRAEDEKKESEAKTQLETLVGKIQAKLSEKKHTEADFTDELKQFDLLLDQHKGEQTDDVAQILFMKAMLYLQAFDDTAKTTELIKKLKTDFPETTQGKKADNILAQLEKQGKMKDVQGKLVVGNAFPDFNEKDLEGKPLSVGNYKGKVVLVDFWATWCGPCVAELPNVLETYKKYHSKGFDIVGISLDHDKDALTNFIKKKGMPWQQYFDGKGWESKLAGAYGVNSIPATYLLDTEGKIAAKDLRGDALAEEVGKLLSKQ